MDTKRINQFLRDIAANNNRPWFYEHRKEYEACKADFEDGVAKAIARIAEFDPEIAHLTPRDCVYRFYRDTRFSEDKSPYKNHFGAYICAHGKKALRGGYYLHVQPGNAMVSIGSYWLPTNILTACRNEIMGNIDAWRKAVESGQFIRYFGYPNASGRREGEEWPAKGFGLEHLKTCPKGFPRDYEFVDYLRMKDYACWHVVPDAFFEGDGWLDEAVRILKVGKPMMDIINSVVDDYE
ncbi:MAG: DUF2461 domain-containing protein [Prevotella sp.]|nr:DUF2461 domain-containing protein [Prevotella sp.]